VRALALVLALTLLPAARPKPDATMQESKPIPTPLVDHHQHFYSVAVIGLARGATIDPLDASALVAYLDAAGIQRAAVLSTAYQFGNPNRPPVADEYEKVKAENDWTSRQVAQFPTRLRGLCGVNPLKEYALEEIARCAQDPSLRSGLKLHFGNSDVDLDNPSHVQQLVRVFRAANDRRMAVVVHMRSSFTMRRAYGAKEAAVFLREVLPAAPQIPVQIAHLTGGGTYDDPATDEALSVFVDAIARKNPAMERVYFDISGIAGYGKWMEHADQVATRIRQLGLRRILFGADGARGGGLAPRDAWASIMKLPLSEQELRTIAGNVAPYMK
jgi:predicted TIM-barrel fold metal-dependent hydrolase